MSYQSYPANTADMQKDRDNTYNFSQAAGCVLPNTPINLLCTLSPCLLYHQSYCHFYIIHLLKNGIFYFSLFVCNKKPTVDVFRNSPSCISDRGSRIIAETDGGSVIQKYLQSTELNVQLHEQSLYVCCDQYPIISISVPHKLSPPCYFLLSHSLLQQNILKQKI